MESIFDKRFTKDRAPRSDICAIGFDGSNNRPNKLLTSLVHKKVFYVNYSVSHSSGYKPIIHLPKSNSGCDGSDGGGKYRAHPTIPVVGLPAFISKYVSHRTIPDKLYDSDPPPTVVMKIDIDGEEIDIIPALIDSGVLCDINVLTVEWHDKLFIDKVNVRVLKSALIDDLRKLNETCSQFEYLEYQDD